MRVGVVGGAGFVGTRLVGRLKTNGTSYAILDIDQSRDPENVVYYDVEAKAGFEEISGFDAIINRLGSNGRGDPATLLWFI